MQKIVIDTNIIISAALSEKGNPAKIMNLVFDKAFKVYYSSEIMAEYINVLARPQFNFIPEKQQYFIEGIKRVGVLISPVISDVPLPDESDRVFYDVAKESGAILITGNAKHYPSESFILTPAEFLQQI
jgi:putative PIN family toxin of toxin-antitoxin system